MLNLYKRSLLNRLVILFVLIAVIPMAVVGYISFTSSKTFLEHEIFNRLEIVTNNSKQDIINYLKERMGDLKILSDSNDKSISYILRLLKDYHNKAGVTPSGPYNTNTEKYRKISNEANIYFQKFVKNYGYYDLFIICGSHGHVMFTAKKESDLGTNLGYGPYKNSNLARLWKKVVNDKKEAMVDYSFYEPSKAPALFIGAPVFDNKGQVAAVIALQISTKDIDEYMHEKSGLGETGESLLIGPDYLLRSDSRFEKSSGILKTKIDTPAVKNALSDKSGIVIEKNYKGVMSLKYYTHLGLDKKFDTDFDWAIISFINTSEIFAPIKELSINISIFAVIIFIVSIIVAFVLGRNISKPIRNISELALKVADGDLKIDVPVSDRIDEVGTLLKAFGKMILSLYEQSKEIRDSLNILATSSNQISTSTAELASAALETDSAVNETASTVEEVRQTTEISKQKAKYVSESAQKASQISQAGKKYSEDTLNEINKIKSQMEFITDSIVRLSEHSQAIGEIISTVDDIAEQSNILAVSAAIEAAKAGEEGKGFTVVAQEIRRLADQSKQATGQVRSILSDIQKATGSAVMAAEQGGKAVDIGVKQSMQAGETINILAQSVAESSQAAMQIEISSQQQLIGTEQVAAAMESIKQASSQNLMSAKQLETAAINIKDLGQKLKQLIDQYKI